MRSVSHPRGFRAALEASTPTSWNADVVWNTFALDCLCCKTMFIFLLGSAFGWFLRGLHHRSRVQKRQAAVDEDGTAKEEMRRKRTNAVEEEEEVSESASFRSRAIVDDLLVDRNVKPDASCGQDERKEGSLNSTTSNNVSEMVRLFTTFSKENELSRKETIRLVQLVIKMRKCELQEKQQMLQEKMLQAQHQTLSMQWDANLIARDNLDLSGEKLQFRKEKNERQIWDEGVKRVRKTLADDLFAGLSIMVLSLVLAGWHMGHLADISIECQDVGMLSTLSAAFVELVPGVAEFRWGVCMAVGLSRVMFSLLVLLILSYILLRQGTMSSYQSTPITILVVLLGVLGGAVGKLVVDGVGGRGIVWMLLWEVFLVAHVLVVKRADVIYRALGLRRDKRRVFLSWVISLSVHGALSVALPMITAIAPFIHKLSPVHGYFVARMQPILTWLL